MHFTVGAATDIGRKRSKNQDNLITVPEIGLFIVADGMGGHKGGETASAMVTEVVPEEVAKAQKHPDWDAKLVLVDSIRAANTAIFKRATETVELEGMGTTTTALLFKNDLLTIGHVGDSRCYYISNHALWQATRDHSLVQEKIRAGLITREQAKTDRMKNVITRSVGFEPTVDVEIYEMRPHPGDMFLLCSDGLSGLISDKKIFEIVEKHAIDEDDLDRTVSLLVAAANEQGGDDNISVIIVKVT